MEEVAVVGGGIVGISCALALQAEGHQVTVFEPNTIGEGASWASCGCIAVGEIVPLSQPGMMLKVPGWLLDSEAPLSLRPSSALKLLPWFTRFTANARPSKMRAIAADLARLTFLATADFKAQLDDIGHPELLIERPIIKLFDDDVDKATMGAAFDLARELGCTIDEISGHEAHELDPAIAPDFKYAVLLRDWSYVTDPKRLVEVLHQTFLKRGGIVKRAGAAGFDREGRQVRSVRLTDGTVAPTGRVVLAAGARSKVLARDLGVPIRLEGVAGYSTALSDPGLELKHTIFYPKGGFGVTPYDGALAVAGTIEFASLDAAPNWNRADVLVRRAHRVLPGLKTEEAERRIGYRPFTPDTRPIIGRSDRLDNVHFATGHGQLGLTLAATTARLVAADMAGRSPHVDIGAFSPDRFA
ncbi:MULTISPECIES: FAD-binding oxidoreductase [unclassified Ruegeria]|uniref:NAD(P)/FAD-dependent oxidoreductase n=1 Tax=unclassified Ruegeria TaxID=2625375 RepID=UPI001489CD7E|nr:MULTISPECIES: FAD-dependent oxidoreductase [unclassified Ruegeria]NOD77696.1 FAD-dependent oxidoreductase [Ruegeria sp. HKCCD4332]NOD89904.1 FAD-dependent oxidoreductase [Ruegeria sp. HKCCD4318]NOE14650.1 FAD-dependent oxidoreductase [Ruegeria sp. HKCCD4318-2]NOG10996.1 FAD-dependent oxidoreductase [Ruegeria sp. HKCCD4315]